MSGQDLTGKGKAAGKGKAGKAQAVAIYSGAQIGGKGSFGTKAFNGYNQSDWSQSGGRGGYATKGSNGYNQSDWSQTGSKGGCANDGFSGRSPDFAAQTSMSLGPLAHVSLTFDGGKFLPMKPV